eukprot:TRINITY_DN12631_c0_g1_i1.p2 TRINITY_DN12631_c0_g1~~TRINITY_DN12631_c0_g1_i1.p2  ORF type:complete len:278 (-),score=60.70 TRINITY_DN12631_c0_g1_i1:278-1111(-)
MGCCSVPPPTSPRGAGRWRSTSHPPGGRARRQAAEGWTPLEVEAEQVYTGHSFGVYCVQAYNGALYTGAMDETVRVYDIETAECTHVFEVDSLFKSMVIADGCLYTAAIGEKRAQAKMWDLASQQLLRCFPSHDGDILAIAVDEHLLFTASGFPDSCVKVWDTRTGEQVQAVGLSFVNEHLRTTRHGHTGAVRGLVAAGGGLLTCSEDRTVKQWEVSTGRCVRTFEGHANEVRGVCMDHTGHFYSVGADKQAYQLWAYNEAAFEHVVQSPKHSHARK